MEPQPGPASAALGWTPSHHTWNRQWLLILCNPDSSARSLFSFGTYCSGVCPRLRRFRNRASRMRCIWDKARNRSLRSPFYGTWWPLLPSCSAGSGALACLRTANTGPSPNHTPCSYSPVPPVLCNRCKAVLSSSFPGTRGIGAAHLPHNRDKARSPVAEVLGHPAQTLRPRTGGIERCRARQSCLR